MFLMKETAVKVRPQFAIAALVVSAAVAAALLVPTDPASVAVPPTLAPLVGPESADSTYPPVYTLPIGQEPVQRRVAAAPNQARNLTTHAPAAPTTRQAPKTRPGAEPAAVTTSKTPEKPATTTSTTTRKPPPVPYTPPGTLGTPRPPAPQPECPANTPGLTCK